MNEVVGAVGTASLVKHRGIFEWRFVLYVVSSLELFRLELLLPYTTVKTQMMNNWEYNSR